MKENPKNEQFRDTMEEGELVKDGFLGEDERPVDEIIAADQALLAGAGFTATRKSTGRAMMWTDLGIHLIQKHGFFQGKGSPYRLEPLELAAFLGLEAE